MSISSEISRISGNVSDALTAIANKGVTVPSGSNSDDLADLIGQISGGGGTTYVTTFDEDMVMRSGSPGWSTYEYYLVPFLQGQTYRITFNGVPYICETQAENQGFTHDGYFVGNAALAGGTDTGEPFIIYRYDFGDPDPTHIQLELDAYATGTVHLKIELAQSGGGGGGIDFPTFTVTMDSEYTTISSIVCDKTFSECEEIGNNHQYYAELEIHAGNNTFTSGAILTDIIEGQLVYSIGTTDVAWLIIRFNENGTITGTIDPIPYRDGSDITVSGATVTVPSGYYEQQETKTVASGTAGTPTATKGTVSNHSVTVTPSVTNTTGYITGSTKTGTAVTVSASELVSGSQNITSNNTYDVTNLASIVVNVSGGSGIGTLLKTTSLGTISSSSTQAASLNISLEVTGINNYDLLIVESSVDSTTNNRHTATVGLIFLTAGSDIGTKNGSTIATAKWNSKLSNTGTATTSVSTTAYGIYPNSCSISNGTASIPMYRRYNSTSTGTINGTYSARVYGGNLYNLIGG